jgi:predicted ArsR family transcriptional regulator
VDSSLDDLEGLKGLADPVRRALYRHVVAQGVPVGRDAAARAVGISRSLAAYHLDRLVDDGLLEPRYERLTERRGPGAGRPSKLYVQSAARFHVSVPARDYELAARLLAAAAETEEDGRAAVARVARGFGAEIGADVARRCVDGASPGDMAACLVEVLVERGYEPYYDDGTIRLRNCPFETLAAEHRELVCGMNLAIMEGAADALPTEIVRPRLDPRTGECCVAFDGIAPSRSQPS